MKTVLPLLSCLLLSLAPIFAQGDGWSVLDVPGPVAGPAGGKFAWYRCFVKVPAAWKGDDLSLTVHKTDNVHEAFVNGVKIGGQGAFPPAYKNGATDTPVSYTVPGKLVRAGEYNLIAIRVYNHDGGKGGFRGAPPVLGNETQAIALKGAWQFRTGDSLAWATDKIDGVPKAATFLKVENVADVTKRLFPAKQGPGPLAPADAATRFTGAHEL